MLILKRTVGDAIKIGDDIEVIILKLDNNRARIGIVAPRNVAIHREEIQQRIRDEKDRSVR